jgi:hypothetical protein
MVRFYPECRRARHALTRLCRCGALAPLFSPIRRTPAKSGSSFLSFLGNLPTFQPFNFQTIPRSIPFRITSFADPHPLTLIESHLYKKQGRGWGPRHLAPTQALSTCPARSNTHNPNLFIRLHRYSSMPRAVGVGLLPLRGSPHFASLHYPFPRFASPPRLKLGAPDEP